MTRRLRENKLRAAFNTGRPVFGSGVGEARNAGLIYALADVGVDYVMIVLEHSPQTTETAADLIAHAHAAEVTPVVRIPDLTYENVTRILDSGCQSIFVPHLKTPDEVRRLLELARYYPEGSRGMGLYGNASANYVDPGSVPVPEATKWQNSQLVLGIMIETREAVDALEEMLQPGVDFVIVGYYDLTQSYGIPGDFGHELMQAAYDRVITTCKEKGVVYGVAARTVSDVGDAIRVGAGLVSYGSELSLVREALRPALQTFTEAAQ